MIVARAFRAAGPRRRTVGVAVVVGVVIAGALGGCTGEDSASSATTTTAAPATTVAPSTTIPTDPAVAAFVAEVNPICVERNQKIQSAAAGVTVPDTAAALAKRARFSIEANEQIRAIAPPPGQEETVAALLASIDQVNEDTAALSEAVLYTDATKGRTAAAALRQELPTLNEQLTAFGLQDCVLNSPTG